METCLGGEVGEEERVDEFASVCAVFSLFLDGVKRLDLVSWCDELVASFLGETNVDWMCSGGVVRSLEGDLGLHVRLRKLVRGSC